MTNKKPEKIKPLEHLKAVLWVIRMFFGFAPKRTLIMILTNALESLAQLGHAFIISLVIDRAVKIVASANHDYQQILPYIFAWIGFNIIERAITRTYHYCQRSLRNISDSEFERILYRQIHRLGMQNIENPDINNQIERSRKWIYDSFLILDQSVYALGGTIQALAAAITIFAFLPLAIPLLFVFTIIRFFPSQHFMRRDVRWHIDNTEERRKAYESSYYLINPIKLQEINSIGAFSFFDRKFSFFFDWFNNGLNKILAKRNFVAFVTDLTDNIGKLTAYALTFINFLNGKSTVGMLTFQIRALDIFSNAINDTLNSFALLTEFSTKMTEVKKLFDIKDLIPDGTLSVPASKLPPQIDFQNISFSYPNSNKAVFNNLSLNIKPGEKIAIVGANGAGKSTLIKLLAKFYAPQKGQILINSLDLKKIKSQNLNEQLGILFQDYNLYIQLSVQDNIALGRPNQKINTTQIIEAAKLADAHNFIEQYPNKYQEIMSERFKGGTRPSGGQAQKIALARFFYRNAPLVVFDEPTSAIDAVSEYKIFNRIYNFFKNKTVIIISHRFSTVRNADRIIVLDKGKIVEEGSHKELIKKNGTYAKAFRLQAEGYQE